MIQANDIDRLIATRTAARAAANFAAADRIRDALEAEGVILEDRPDGTTDWRRSKSPPKGDESMIRMKTTVSCFDGTTTHAAGICEVPAELAKRLAVRGQGMPIGADDAPLAPAAAIAVLRLNADDLAAADPAVRKVLAADAVALDIVDSSKGE